MKARLFVAILSVLLLSSLPSFAQTGSDDQPPFDVFAGFSHSSNFGTGLNGWILAGNYSLNNSWL
ncbi:MAG TPA: hypothetical protein VFW31_18295, partial [Candidatus Angelobacter sp.]|nr:hypothetical protein [Candidatus Angelobacter sp.]